MADLTDLQSAETIKIAGASASGLETNFIAEFNAQLQSADLLNGSAADILLSVSTSAVEAKVGSTNLANRKIIIIQAQASGFRYGFSSSAQPFELPNGSVLSLALGPNISVWVRKNSGTGNVAVAEIS